jgi:hypothetical protein
LIRCDYETQRRTIKASGRWYADLIRNEGVEEAGIASADHAREGVET